MEQSMFINNAYAQAAAASAQDGFIQFLPLIGLVAVFYFLVLRPQTKRAKELKAMTEALQRGDEVLTTGGMLGRITKVNDQYVGVELAQNVEVTVQKSSIQSVLPKGTIGSIK
jgi:preprotein translocase subunit YajC